MKYLLKISLAAIAVSAAILVRAQSANVAPADTTITTVINETGVIFVSHPDALELRLHKVNVENDTINTEAPEKRQGRVRKMGGYRVQVYSDNNARTAKNEARAKERAILSRFPDLATYVVYDSPYWRLRVGDCRTRAEADELAAELKSAFPSYRAEITVVRDRINSVN